MEPHRRAKSESLLVFFSFDLVNSTRYKGINRDGWPFVTQRFYESTIDAMNKWLVGARVWKYVGDEVLMYKVVTQNDELTKCLRAAAEVISSTRGSIHALVPDATNLLDVKGTLWCARVGRFEHSASTTLQGSASSGKAPNLVFLSDLSTSKEIDFLGPDIDVGFRIAKHAARSRLVVSAELAYLLYLNRVSYPYVEEQLKIVAYEVLKGIWDDRRYPILWCEQDWSRTSGTFLYDEQYDNSIIRQIKSDPSSLGELKSLTKVLRDHGRLADLETLAKDLAERRLADEAATLGRSAVLSPRIEVHCAAVCFRPDGRVLIAKRPSDKRRFPGLWEFGCGQLAINEGIADCLRRNYRADFGVDIEFITDDPRPIQSYVISDSDQGRTIPGIVFVAQTKGDDAKPTKHSTVDWLDPSKFDEFGDDSFVPHSRERIRLAVATWRELVGKKT